MGFSATFGSFLFSLADTGLIIAYVRGLGQILVNITRWSSPLIPPVPGVYLPIPARPIGGFAPLIYPVGMLAGNR